MSSFNLTLLPTIFSRLSCTDTFATAAGLSGTQYTSSSRSASRNVNSTASHGRVIPALLKLCVPSALEGGRLI